MKDFKQIIGNVIPLRRKKFNPKQRNLVKLGCAALALALVVGKVPFLRGLAAKEDSVSGSDIVSGSDSLVVGGDAVEMKQYDEAGVQEGSCGDNATYTLDENGTLTISGRGVIDSRAQFFNLAVTRIVFAADSHITALGSNVFNSIQGLRELTIPDSVTSIESSAVENCRYLTRLNIGSGVSSVGNRAFFDCISLETLTIPSNVRTIGEKAFGIDTNEGAVGLSGLIDFIGDSLASGSFPYLKPSTTVRIPEGFSIGGTVVTQENKSSFFGSATVIMPGADEPFMTLNETSLNLYLTSRYHQGVILEPVFADGVNNRHVSWSSSNPGIVRVFSNGIVEAMSVGTATVTATSMGGQTAECVCSVTTPMDIIEAPDQDNLPVHATENHPGFLRCELLLSGEEIYCTEHNTPSLEPNPYQTEFGYVSGKMTYTWDYRGEDTDVDIQFMYVNPEYGFEKMEVTVTPTGGTDAGFVEFGTFEPVRKGSFYRLPLTIHGAGKASVNVKFYANGLTNYSGEKYNLVVNDCTYKDPQWNWAEDNSSVTVKWTYSFDGSVTEPVQAVLSREVTLEPTCVDEGSAALTAKANDPNGKEWSDEKSEPVEATGIHTFEWVTDTDPTCAEPGAQHEECTVCHATQSEGTEIDPTGNHTWEWVTDTEPTCGESGAKHEECTVCHATQSEGTVIDPTGAHTWEWVTDTEPTETDPGEKHEEDRKSVV